MFCFAGEHAPKPCSNRVDPFNIAGGDREKGFASSSLVTCIAYMLEVSWAEACIALES